MLHSFYLIFQNKKNILSHYSLLICNLFFESGRKQYKKQFIPCLDYDYGYFRMPFDHRPSFNSNDDKSNVGIPGLWIYEISQLPDIPYIRKPKRKVKFCGKSYAKPSSVAVFSASAKQISIECPGLVTKDQNWGGRSYEENLQVKLIGSSFNKTIDNSDIDFDIYSAKLTFDAPEFWGVNEVVGMSVTAEELEQKIEATLSFTQDQHSRPLEVSTVEGSGILQVSWPEATINETINLLYTEYAYNGMLIFKPRFFDNEKFVPFSYVLRELE